MIIKSNRKGHKKCFIRMNLAYKIILALIVMAVTAVMVATHRLLHKSHMTKSLIPKIIWQTAKSHNPPPASKKIIETWDEKNPDWKRTLLDDGELLIFMKKHFNQTVVDAFKDLPLPVMKADFFRLAAMYYEGGVYADVDVECRTPIHKWGNGAIGQCSVVIGMENDRHFCNWGFASRAKHDIFGAAVELVLSKFINGVAIEDNIHFVHFVTGPASFTEAIVNFAQQAGCDFGTGDLFSQLIYNNCQKILKEKYGVCLFDEKVHLEWFQNRFSSQNKDLQSEDWMTSWTKDRNTLLGIDDAYEENLKKEEEKDTVNDKFEKKRQTKGQKKRN